MKVLNAPVSRKGAMRDVLALVSRMDTATIADYAWRGPAEFTVFLSALKNAPVPETAANNQTLVTLQHRLDILATVETTISTKFPHTKDTHLPMVREARSAVLNSIRHITKAMQDEASPVLTDELVSNFDAAATSLMGVAPVSAFSLSNKTDSLIAGRYLEFPYEGGTIWTVYVASGTPVSYSVAVLHDFALLGMFSSTPQGRSSIQNALYNELVDSGVNATKPTTPRQHNTAKVLKVEAKLTVRDNKLVARFNPMTPEKAHTTAATITNKLSKMFVTARVPVQITYELLSNQKYWEAALAFEFSAPITQTSKDILASMGLDTNAIQLFQDLGSH